jgi:hypothetical protein
MRCDLCICGRLALMPRDECRNDSPWRKRSEYVRIEYQRSEAVKKPRRGSPTKDSFANLYHHCRRTGEREGRGFDVPLKAMDACCTAGLIEPQPSESAAAVRGSRSAQSQRGTHEAVCKHERMCEWQPLRSNYGLAAVLSSLMRNEDEKEAGAEKSFGSFEVPSGPRDALAPKRNC